MYDMMLVVAFACKLVALCLLNQIFFFYFGGTAVASEARKFYYGVQA